MDKLVTILTVVYNGEATIGRTIESVLNQTYSPIEYIVIDGASSDNTLNIVNGYKRRFVDGKNLVIISEPDGGMYDALNKGVNLASGKLIGNINADDWYNSNAVEEMVKLFNEENYDIAWADLIIHKRNKSIIKKAKVGKLWTTAHFCHPTMFSQKEILLKFPYLSENMDDDFDMILRANKAGIKFCVLNKAIANYSFGGMSTQKSIYSMHKRIKMKYDTYIRNGYSRFYWFYCVAVEIVKFFS